ncbi:GNAT family N-acetyltransferase (plasmid) [Paraburkholderia sprentiae WSM5005]|uniref:GNAT family N-acetyltransferase n=1 Tax=Paraburkholderia sprentiae WSM5005 TaxID=754502 RepID=A0A1I9YTF3_9BURK|nr:GNAT family N-acetyltransferase [Paraburkholderia sprentiae]APA89491.1 GNAT family N-acetyltransferase [Paraburkholderia sprentiae WSM5005]
MDDRSDFFVRNMSSSEVDLAIEWAAAEGWNPGLHDAQCFWNADPNGFFVGIWRGEPVACISAVAYDERFGFIGLYIVKPAFRSMGFGRRTWQHAMRYLADRTIGLDGVVAQQQNYQKSGFQLAYRNIRFQGVVRAASAANVMNARAVPFAQLVAYDSACFSTARSRFLAGWIAQPQALALAHVRNAQISGYGVLRRCRTGYKIGPLFADDARIANDLFDGLAASVAGEVITLDVPEINAAAVALAQRNGMVSVFETARMYTRATPAVPVQRVFGVSSFELG